jgi:His-Xaa-Ser system protein HxsD
MGSGFDVKGGELVLRLNPKVYPLERVYATLYVFLDRFYFILDGDKDKEIVVYAKPKRSQENLEAFAHDFFEEMLSITNYFNQFERNKDVIGMLLQRALFSAVPKAEEKPIEQPSQVT